MTDVPWDTAFERYPLMKQIGVLKKSEAKLSTTRRLLSTVKSNKTSFFAIWGLAYYALNSRLMSPGIFRSRSANFSTNVQR